MKPKEFDDLVRRKFDQNDFAYSPGNWDKLAEQLDGRAKKRSMIMWLWMPALGMAASVALAVGVTGMLRLGTPGGNNANGEYTQTSMFIQQPVQDAVAAAPAVPVVPAVQGPQKGTKAVHALPVKQDVIVAANYGIRMSNVLNVKSQIKKQEAEINLAAVPQSIRTQPAPQKRNDIPIETPGYNTFKRAALAMDNKPVKFSVILSGGISQGAHTSGYAAGATVRRMLNDKVFVESDIAFASSGNTQQTPYTIYASGPNAGQPVAAAKVGTAAKLAKTESGDAPLAPQPKEETKIKDRSFNLYYAQVTPSVGYKLMKRMSVGLGPDFQKALADNRPTVNPGDYRGNIPVVPLFDVGFMAKTEYALTKKVKAAVYYRKGVNSLISLTDKFIDRDYLQFQVKCAIFNR